MSTRFTAHAAAWSVGVLCVASPASATGLVVNGDFETGDFTGWGALAGVVFASDFGHNSTNSALFNQAIPGILSQEVGLSGGQEYTLSFWVYNLGVGEDSLTVSIDDQVLLADSPVGSPLEDWMEFSLNFTADINGENNTLSFLGIDGISAFYIDDISVRPVPAPGAVVLASLAGLVSLPRRRRA